MFFSSQNRSLFLRRECELKIQIRCLQTFFITNTLNFEVADLYLYLEKVLEIEHLEVKLTVSVLAIHGRLVAGRADGEGALEDERELTSASGTT